MDASQQHEDGGFAHTLKAFVLARRSHRLCDVVRYGGSRAVFYGWLLDLQLIIIELNACSIVSAS